MTTPLSPLAVVVRLANFLVRNLFFEIKSDSIESFRRRHHTFIIIFIIYPIIIILLMYIHITINFLLLFVKLRYFGIFSF